ncbi:hypothetical protein FHL15_004178 [Xylaria flabelliformis]|uniref:DnaJ-like protein C11 C-terminal domain-containing protein n=1 Tax=Xylaria flabelliformis TaxID=2512241 RepID=A0A553I4J0_9PEZI|nr:hypothetical protein FHL15_004178 [Xylaria flabelliformis]
MADVMQTSILENGPYQDNTACRRFRVEAEIGIGSYNTGYLTFRCLKRVGLLSKVTPESTYQRPILPVSSDQCQFKDSTFYFHRPIFELCAMRAMRSVQYRTKSGANSGLPRFRGGSRYTQKCRSEADTLTSLITPAVERRQKPEARENDLMILSAKYGVKARGASDATAWGVAEVADVTIPVAALVDRNRLLIPSGVYKRYILGFWDPDLSEEKILHFRSSYQGKEGIVEVRGDGEKLVLPPPLLLYGS